MSVAGYLIVWCLVSVLLGLGIPLLFALLSGRR